jgi:Rod binding domain-containing protein
VTPLTGISGIDGLPPLGPGALPADIQRAPQAKQEEYRAALGFERTLVEQLAKTMTEVTEASKDSSEDGSEGGGATQTYLDMLPGALADQLTSAGGLGLARALVPATPEAGSGHTAGGLEAPA